MSVIVDRVLHISMLQTVPRSNISVQGYFRLNACVIYNYDFTFWT